MHAKIPVDLPVPMDQYDNKQPVARDERGKKLWATKEGETKGEMEGNLIELQLLSLCTGGMVTPKPYPVTIVRQKIRKLQKRDWPNPATNCRG